jgi:hypothetical protein
VTILATSTRTSRRNHFQDGKNQTENRSPDNARLDRDDVLVPLTDG